MEGFDELARTPRNLVRVPQRASDHGLSMPFAWSEPLALCLQACGHHFCEACLVSMLAPLPVAGNRKKVACPTCREPTQVHGGRVQELAKNFVVLSLLE